MRLAALAVLLLLGGCATASSDSAAGTAGPIAWSIDEARVQEELGGDRVKWRYRLKLRNIAGVALTLTGVTREMKGTRLASSALQYPIDLRLAAGSEQEFLCIEAVTTRPTSRPGRYDLTVTKTYAGRDATGRPIEVRVPVVLDRFLPRREPALLDFARFIAGTVSGHVYCETMPPEVQVFDPDRQDAVHFLIAIDNVRRRVQARTRWIDPAGGEVKVVSSDIRADSGARAAGFVYTTHTLATSLLRGRPGQWKVELALDGQSQGTFTFEATAGPGSRS